MAEVHDAVADILVISEGQITFVMAARSSNGKTTRRARRAARGSPAARK